MIELKIKEDVKLLTKLTKIACVSGISLDVMQDKMIDYGVNKDIVDIVVSNNKSVKSELNISPESHEVISCAQVLVDTLLAQDEEKLDDDDRRSLREMISWEEENYSVN